MIIFVLVELLIFIEVSSNNKIKRLESKLRIDRMRGHIKDVELISKDIHAMSYEIQKIIDNNKI